MFLRKCLFGFQEDYQEKYFRLLESHRKFAHLLDNIPWQQNKNKL